MIFLPLKEVGDHRDPDQHGITENNLITGNKYGKETETDKDQEKKQKDPGRPHGTER